MIMNNMLIKLYFSTGIRPEKNAVIEDIAAYLSTKEAKATIIANSGIVKINSTDKSWNDIKANYTLGIKKSDGTITIS